MRLKEHALSMVSLCICGALAVVGCSATGPSDAPTSSPAVFSATPSLELESQDSQFTSTDIPADPAVSSPSPDISTTVVSGPRDAQISPEAQDTPDAQGTPDAQEPDGAERQRQNSPAFDGWTMDYHEGFDGSLRDTKWEPYGWQNPPVGSGGLGVRSQENTLVQDGKLILRTKFENDQWSAGGTSSGGVFTASRGRWEVRARFPQSKGIGYCFLLWPADEGWPPEINFAEGSATNPKIMGTYHWDPDNKQEHRFFQNPDMNGWHTYGVIVEDDRIIFTFDGQEAGRIEQSGITTKEMFLAVQAAALDPNGEASQWELTVDGGVPGPLTPAVSDVEIDWVAHYTRN